MGGIEASLALRSVSVLVISHDSQVNYAGTRAFAAPDYCCHCIAAPSIAVRQFAQIHPDVVIIDTAVVGWSTVIQQIRSQGSDVPVILVADRTSQPLLGSQGILGILYKPLELDSLRDSVRGALPQLHALPMEAQPHELFPPQYDSLGSIGDTTNWRALVESGVATGTEDLYDIALNEMERRFLPLVMQHSGGSQVKASRLLGITRGSLRKKLRHLGFLPRSGEGGEIDPSELDRNAG